MPIGDEKQVNTSLVNFSVNKKLLYLLLYLTADLLELNSNMRKVILPIDVADVFRSLLFVLKRVAKVTFNAKYKRYLCFELCLRITLR